MTSKTEEASIISRFENRMPEENHPGPIVNWKHDRDCGMSAEINSFARAFEGSEILVHVTGLPTIGYDAAGFGDKLKITADVRCSITEHSSVCCWTSEQTVIERGYLHAFGKLIDLDLSELSDEVKKEITDTAECAVEEMV